MLSAPRCQKHTSGINLPQSGTDLRLYSIDHLKHGPEVAALAEPPDTEKYSPVAVARVPPDKEKYSPVAVGMVPPDTEELIPEAVLVPPPDTDEQSPEA